jgi:hypothetical protein
MSHGELFEAWSGEVLPLVKPGEMPQEAAARLRKMVYTALGGLGIDGNERIRLLNAAKIDEAIMRLDDEDNYWPEFVEVPFEEADHFSQQSLAKLVSGETWLLAGNTASFVIGEEDGTLFVGERAEQADAA